MSQGDNLWGIKTVYGGTEFRSKLESKVAYLLDSLKIKWIYEPKSFLLNNGTPYIPDFYLPELRLWVEVKGLIEDHNKEISKRFVIENDTTLMLLSSNKIFWYDNKLYSWGDEFNYGYGEDNMVYLGCCSKCLKCFFCSNLGYYGCRSCNYHNGDHDLLFLINEQLNEELLDFSDIKSIKSWLKSVKVRGGGDDFNTF